MAGARRISDTERQALAAARNLAEQECDPSDRDRVPCSRRGKPMTSFASRTGFSALAIGSFEGLFLQRTRSTGCQGTGSRRGVLRGGFLRRLPPSSLQACRGGCVFSGGSAALEDLRWRLLSGRPFFGARTGIVPYRRDRRGSACDGRVKLRLRDDDSSHCDRVEVL